ncbi:MAG: UvrD-helicase domain-containing protein [Thermodesulfobacteriota bacterium]
MNNPLELTPRQKQALAFEANLCVLAGAGSGKTLTLVELIMKLLAGETPGFEGGLDLNRILALTYTEKAAREMGERLRRAIMARMGDPDPAKAAFWLRQRRLLDRAQISTIHGFCQAVLRQHCLKAGLEPDYSILARDQEFLIETRRQILLDWLQHQDPDLLAMLDYLPWQGQGRGVGLERVLEQIIDRMRTFGRKVAPARRPFISLKPAIDQLIQAAELIEDYNRAGHIKPGTNYYHRALDFTSAARGLTDSKLKEKELLDAALELQSLVKGNWGKVKPARDLADQALKSLAASRDERAAEPLKTALSVLAEKMNAGLAEARLRRAVLDFDDLLLLTRRLLSQNPEVRSRLKSRFRVVLVDEFQDANRLQADILAYLLEPEGEEQTHPEETTSFTGLPRAQRRLVVFGDPKQSIYRFRGAEVEVYQALKNSLTGPEAGSSGRLIALNKNFRSQKRLVEFYNEFFPGIMPSGTDYEAEYGPEDRQDWHRPDLGPGPKAFILSPPTAENEARRRALEAQALAAYLADLLSGRSEVRIGEKNRRPEPKDVALLLHRFTHLKVYEQAFTQAGLPFYTVRGRGFFQCPEVMDLINFLFHLADPSDGPALLAVLRSPLFGLSDQTLTRLAWPSGSSGEQADMAAYFQSVSPPWPEGVDQTQLEALAWTREILSRLKEQAGLSFPVELVEMLVEESDYVPLLLARPQGEQQAANVQKFIELMRHYPYESAFAVREVARYLRARLAAPAEDPEAQSGAEGAQAIQIMTIHQAKGLEFPVVLIPDAGWTGVSEKNPIAFGRNDLFALRFQDPESQEDRRPADFAEFKKEAEARERAEYVRLLYVAATRARDHLVFSGHITGRRDSWLFWLDDFARTKPELLGRIQLDDDLRLMQSAETRPVGEGERLENASGSSARRILNRVLTSIRDATRYQALAVTELTEFLFCPRRYYLEKLIGQGSPPSLEVNESSRVETDARQKGILFHYLMESLDLDGPARLEALTDQVQERAKTSGVALLKQEAEIIADRALSFLKSPWGRDLIRSRNGLVRRECPIWLKIKPDRDKAPGFILTGEIDLFYITSEGLARVIDYKYAWPEKVEKYDLQVKIYALALVKAGLTGRVEAGLYFAAPERGESMAIRLEPGWEVDLEKELIAAARRLGSGFEDTAWARPMTSSCPDSACSLSYCCR